jgi:hypothetical protein
MDINKLFDLLDDWRHLPAYQLERRADIFFAIHLEEILKKIKGVSIDLIIPEFPVRIGNIYPEKAELNKSFKIDYLGYSKRDDKVFLIELKTDQSSRRSKQDWYLEQASKIGVNGLVDGVLKIYKATNQKVKYEYLLGNLEAINWISKTDEGYQNLAVSISPEIVYIQPLNMDRSSGVICFDDIIDSLADSNNEITIRFLQSLERWKSNVNKR